MPVNPFFNFTTFATEQDLVQDLIDESIQIHGHSVYYLPREGVNEDHLFGEDTLMRYPSAFEIEMYILSNRIFEGRSEFISKFGLGIEDQCTFSVSVRRWHDETVTGGHAPTLTRPRENDIIWIQMSPGNRYLFNIQFVEDKEELFQLGKLYTYKLKCELMTYSHENVQTNQPEIDDVASDVAYSIELPLGTGTGTFATNETVWQGPNVFESVASGTVRGFDANTFTLLLQNVAGTFDANNGPVFGANANFVILNTPDTSLTVHDHVADNDFLTQHSDVIVIRNNPRIK